tara:strand:- start:808 stop:1113 length:306 start_codon:yes stop_codon:yes gene_type:complete
MAKKSKVVKNLKRKELVQRYAERRATLKNIIKDVNSSVEDRINARIKLAKLPLDSNPNRVRNRCNLTGRPRAYYRKFGLSRIAFREMALKGYIPGISKASW